ncbi:MAG: thioredoxin family protein [Promethearchaeota archaeon]
MNVSSLKWADLTSPTISIEEYKEKYGIKDAIKKNHESYELKKEKMEKIIKLLKNKRESLKIVALGTEWCKECILNIPCMIKIVENLYSPVFLSLHW